MAVNAALSAAINKGAPLFNRGDVEGCAKLYKQTAEACLASAQQAEKTRLSAGLEQARSSVSAKDAAWALRRAFDDVLAGQIGRGHDAGGDTAHRVSGHNSDVQERIREAISVGVPLYNGGDRRACAEVYEVCLRDIEAALDSHARQAVRSTLQQLASLGDDDRRAWALRKNMDSILDGLSGARQDRRSSGAPRTELCVDFASEAGAWRSVNDGVMGGRSSGGLSLGSENGEPCGVFEGVLSTENNGGFSSVRGPNLSGADLSSFGGLAITFKGDGRRYKLTIKTDMDMDSPMYQADFMADGGGGRGWVTKELAWSAFKPSWRGRVVDSAPRLTGKGVMSLGLMISFLTDSGAKSSDFRTGPFRLAIKCIKAC